MAVMPTRGDVAVGQAQAPELQLLIDSTPSMIHTGWPDGYLDFFKQTWLRYVGRSLEDLQGWRWTAFIHPEDVEGIVERWRASLTSGQPFLHEAASCAQTANTAGCCATNCQCAMDAAKWSPELFRMHGLEPGRRPPPTSRSAQPG